MSRPDEGQLHAWLDGELDAAESARVERLVAEDAEWAAAAAEARGVMAASSRILRALDVVPGDVIPRGGSAAPASEERRGPPVRTAVQRVMPTWIRMAAVFAFVAGVGYLGRSQEEVRAPAPPPPSATQSSEARETTRPAEEAERSVAPPARMAEQQQAVSMAAAALADAPPEVTPAAPAPAPVAAAVAKPAPAPLPMAGVAGGVARDVMRRSPIRTLESPNSIALVNAEAARAKGADDGGLTGCWRIAATTAGAIAADTLQRALAITAGPGDTLLVRLAPRGVTARVIHVAPDTLRGTAPDTRDRSTEFTATRITCPASP